MKRTLKRESKVLEIAEIEGMATSIGRRDFTGRLRSDVPAWIASWLPCAGRSWSYRTGPGRVGRRSRWIRTGRDGRRQGDCPRGQNIQAVVNGLVGIEARICHG
jgi:hypothetical protein